MIDLRPDHLEIVRDLLRQHVPGCEVRAFGSRFKWTAKQASDLDLAVVGTKRLPTKKIMRLKEAFEESILPMRVDVLDWHAITPEFQRVIDAGFEVIQGGEVSPLAPASSPSAAGSSATPLFSDSYLIEKPKLTDICLLIVDCPHSTPVWTESGKIVLRSQNIRGGRLDLSETSYTDQDHFKDRIRRAVPQPDDLVITREAPMGEVCKIPSGLECCLGQRMVLLRPDTQKVSPGYLLYALQSAEVQHQIMWSEGTGSTVSNLRIPHLEALKIPLPNLAIQKKIAGILSALEARIELCRRTNETLEFMARALFKDWFIDFGPVRAKLEARAPYLSADLWSLFPDRLIDSELGEIPEGWQLSALGSILRWSKNTINPSDFGEEIFEHFSLPAYDSGKAPTLESGGSIKSQKFLVPPESILVSKLNPAIERVWWPDPSTEYRSVSSTEFLVAVPIAAPRTYLFEMMRSSPVRDSLCGNASGTSNSHQRVRPADIDGITIPLPSQEILLAFDFAASELVQQVLQNRQQVASLSTLRDTLLPKLLSGELSLSEFEAVQEGIQ